MRGGTFVARPARACIARVISLEGLYLVPPYADAHTHSPDGTFNWDNIRKAYLDAGVLYVQVLANHRQRPTRDGRTGQRAWRNRGDLRRRSGDQQRRTSAYPLRIVSEVLLPGAAQRRSASRWRMPTRRKGTSTSCSTRSRSSRSVVRQLRRDSARRCPDPQGDAARWRALRRASERHRVHRQSRARSNAPWTAGRLGARDRASGVGARGDRARFRRCARGRGGWDGARPGVWGRRTWPTRFSPTIASRTR